MSKNLGNIPRQTLMSETQQQTFTNGINKGRKLTRSALHKKAIALMESYKDNPSIDKFIKELFD